MFRRVWKALGDFQSKSRASLPSSMEFQVGRIRLGFPWKLAGNSWEMGKVRGRLVPHFEWDLGILSTLYAHFARKKITIYSWCSHENLHLYIRHFPASHVWLQEGVFLEISSISGCLKPGIPSDWPCFLRDNFAKRGKCLSNPQIIFIHMCIIYIYIYINN